MKTLILLVLACAFGNQLMAQIKLSGSVTDQESGEGIPGAQLYIPDLAYGTKTEVDGSYSLTDLPAKELLFQLTASGYETQTLVIDLSSVGSQDFNMIPAHVELDEVVISNPGSRLQSENIMGIESAKVAKLKGGGALSVTEGLSSIKGVDVTSTGVGIGKPVIRGLSGNRIVTYADGVRIENQQWGGEHGLGIGDLGIGGVEVIKGPASLLYGSDAMGGVIYFIPENYAEANTIQFYGESAFNSGTIGTMNEYGFKLNKRVKLNVGGSYNSHANYLLPSAKYAGNTAFDEGNFRAAFGFNTKNWVTNIRYDFLINHFGISTDSVPDSLINRNYEMPFQEIRNHRFAFDNTFFLASSKLKLTIGYSSNIRKEFEEHEEEEEEEEEGEHGEEAALNMELNTGTYDLKWYKPLKNKKSLIVTGLQGMYQGNTNSGEETIVPDSKIIDLGWLFLFKHSFNENLTVQLGERLDFRAVSAEGTEDTAHNHIAPFVDNLYGGLTVSGGLIYTRKASKIRFNVATGYRAPNISELTAFGVHHGALRFEIGSVDLRKEQNVQVDLEYERDGEHLKFAINPFLNSVKDYIYLDPDTAFIDGFRVYNYRQDDVLLFGAEVGVHFHPHGLHWLHLESNFSYVQAKYFDGGHPPLTPQPRLNSTIRIEFKNQGSFKFENVYVNHIYKSAQNQLGFNELASDDYHLLNAGLNMRLTTRLVNLQFVAGVRNITNTSYIDHLSRFKDLGLNAMGRNFFFSLRFDLTGDLNRDYNAPPSRQEQIRNKNNPDKSSKTKKKSKADKKK